MRIMKNGGRSTVYQKQWASKKANCLWGRSRKPHAIKILATMKWYVKYTQRRMNIFYSITQLLSMNPSSLGHTQARWIWRSHFRFLVNVTEWITEKTKAAGCRNQILHRRTRKDRLFTGIPKGFIAIAKEETVDQITAYSRFVFLTFYKASFSIGRRIRPLSDSLLQGKTSQVWLASSLGRSCTSQLALQVRLEVLLGNEISESSGLKSKKVPELRSVLSLLLRTNSI